jgi:hypothetical protein
MWTLPRQHINVSDQQDPEWAWNWSGSVVWAPMWVMPQQQLCARLTQQYTSNISA